MWPRHMLASVSSPWDHLRPPTTVAATTVLNSRENPAVHKSRLQAFYFYLVRMMMKPLVVLSPSPPLPALRCAASSLWVTERFHQPQIRRLERN